MFSHSLSSNCDLQAFKFPCRPNFNHCALIAAETFELYKGANVAEQAAEHRDKLGIAGKVKDVASVHKTLWPEENQREPILNLAILTGQIQLQDSPG